MRIRRHALLLLLLACCRLPARPAAPGEAMPLKTAAGLISTWHTNSHAEVILGRLIQTYTMDDRGEPSRLKLASVYLDRPSWRDFTQRLSEKYGFPIELNVRMALTLGTGKLAVDCVFIVTEHGDYPISPTGRIMFQHRRLFAEVVEVFEESGRVAPVFIDKHVADNWADCRWIAETARRMKIPLMAGSSVPGTWRRPAADVRRDAPLKEIVGVSYGGLDAYGFHGLEMVQSLAERRRGGETGIASVQWLSDDAVWQAAGTLYDPALLAAALGRLGRPLPKGKPLRELIPHPELFHLVYRDGLRVSLLTLNIAVVEWASAWRYGDGTVDSTLFWTQEKVPFMHFTYLVKGIEQMAYTGTPAWPFERTLLTSGALDFLFQSRREAGRRIKTPQLRIKYRSAWDWQQPPEPE